MNATTFTPDAGTLFYVRSTLIRERVVGGGLFGDSSTATVIKERDESYSGDIFECAGSDDTAVVGIRKTPGYGDARKQVFKRDRWAFSPVGPEVASAMFAQPSETSPSGAILSGSDSVEHSTE